MSTTLPASITRTPCGIYVDRSLPSNFTKILIANRGEIACRVIRTCKELGVKTVAIYSDADANSQHAKLADEAYRIGEPPAAKSYLLGEQIIEIAKRTGAQAIHPGYGFLSENAEFSELCDKNGIVFIGPPPGAIRAMGSKSASKEIMTSAQVPVVPGYHGSDQSLARLKAEAEKMGYPLMLKAVAGGGGKGMRIVMKPEELEESLEACKREAKNSFKNEDILIERYIVRPRHIEFQIFADKHGNAVHLYERDCSVQRRHQKVLEEAPAPGMSPELRAKMGDSAVMAAKAVGYVGAGTVEFIFDADTDEYYFMEMNTRLQVEHPVTEMIMRKDLVQWQLHVAAGHKLPVEQKDLSNHGYAIEARIYAENPDNNFLPAVGRLAHLRTPKSSESVRVETGIIQGDEVSMFYDPMIAKLLAWGPDRTTALRRLHSALGDFQIVGPVNNISFLRKAVLHPAFMKGRVDTSFIPVYINDLVPKGLPCPSYESTAAAITYLLLREAQQSAKQAASTADASSPWSLSDSFRVTLPHTRTVKLAVSGPVKSEADAEVPPVEVVVKTVKTGSYELHFKDGHVMPVEAALTSDRDVSTRIGGGIYNATIVLHGNEMHVFLQGEKTQFTIPEANYGSAKSEAGRGCSAPMSGKIVKLLVQPNVAVKKGTPLVVMEAMKMEHIIRAPMDGVVESFPYAAGDFVDGGKIVAVFKK